MNRFRTVRDAKEYLIGRIVAQADRDGVPLSDLERKMLYFSETGWTLPNMMSFSREFDQSCDQDEYERKIGQIIRRIHDRAESKCDDSWDEALDRLRDEDHYLSVLIDGAFRRSDKFSRRDKVRVILAAAVVLAVIFPVVFLIDSHIDNPAIAKLLGQSALLVLVILVAFLATRGRRDSA